MSSGSGSEYRVIGKDRQGRPVHRHITAPSYADAKRRAQAIFKAQGGSVQGVRKKKLFSYRVKRGDKIIEGFQSAYSRGEVVEALERLGFKIRFVRRSFDFLQGAPPTEIVSFISQSAKLLEQKLPFHEVLQLMANNTREKNLRGALREIINDLRNGTDSREAFLRQSRVLGPHTAMLLGIATKSGDMRSIFESVARLVERQADFKKGVTTSLMLPGITAVTLFGAIAFYVLYLLPEMMEMLGPMMDKVPPLTEFTLGASAWIKDNLWLLFFLTVSAGLGFYSFMASPEGKFYFDKYVIRIPYIGGILRNTSIEIFCRVLGIMYTSAGENIDAIQIAADASGNRYFARQIRTVAIPTMLKFGTELGRALDETGFFPEMVISRFKTGAETGNVKSTAVQLADFYQMENGYAMKNLTNVIEMSVTLLITLSLVFLTFLSSESASIKINAQ